MFQNACRTLIAMLCIFATLQAAASSTTIASQGTSQAIQVANDEVVTNHVVSLQMANLAATLKSFTEAADKDGTLVKQSASFLSYSSGSAKLPHAAFIRLTAYGFKGDESQVEHYMGSITDEVLLAAQSQVRTNGMKSVLLAAVTSLNNLAAQLAENPTAKLSLASAHLLLVDCPIMAEFLAITAIGAVASLGGVNPLGDLLGAIGAVGAFGCYCL